MVLSLCLEVRGRSLRHRRTRSVLSGKHRNGIRSPKRSLDSNDRSTVTLVTTKLTRLITPSTNNHWARFPSSSHSHRRYHFPGCDARTDSPPSETLATRKFPTPAIRGQEESTTHDDATVLSSRRALQLLQRVGRGCVSQLVTVAGWGAAKRRKNQEFRTNEPFQRRFPGKVPPKILHLLSTPPRQGDDRDVSAGSPPVKLGLRVSSTRSASSVGGGGSSNHEVGVFRGFRPEGAVWFPCV